MDRKGIVDRRPDAYGSFMVDDFPARAFACAEDSPQLERIVFDLVADWRCASYAGAMPAQIPNVMKMFHDSHVNNVDNFSGVLQHSDTIIALLSRELPELATDPQLVRKIRQNLVTTAAGIRDATAGSRSELDAGVAWESFLSLEPFQMGLHSTMRLVYVAVYCAYENFLVRALSLGEGGSKVRISDQNFRQRFRKLFGSTTDTALTSEQMHRFRLVRNALVHAGGRLTPDLEELEKKSTLPVVAHDGALHIFPEHIRSLYHALREPALTIMAAQCLRAAPPANAD